MQLHSCISALNAHHYSIIFPLCRAPVSCPPQEGLVRGRDLTIRRLQLQRQIVRVLQGFHELALTCLKLGLLPAGLHLTGAVNVVTDRLSRGFVSDCSVTALGLNPGSRRRPAWRGRPFWLTPEVFTLLAR